MASLMIKMVWVLTAASMAVVACVWAAGIITSPSARDITLTVHTDQRKAEKLFNTAEVRVYNKVSCSRLLGWLRLEPVLTHSEACGPPSTALRLFPVFGGWMLSVSCHSYSVCVARLLRRLKFIRIGMACVVSLVPGMAVLWLLRLSRAKFRPFSITEREDEDRENNSYYDKQHDTLTEKDEDKYNTVQDEVQDNTLFLQHHVPFMTQQQLRSLGTGRLLSVGGYGSVRQLTCYDGTEAVIKELFSYELTPLLREARVLVELNGAGGVPRLLGVCLTPPALVQEFVGETYDKFLALCSIEGFLRSLIRLIHLLGEVHAVGFIHNDLKMNNITFTGSVIQPLFHIIDFGWACRAGQVVVKCDRPVRVARNKNSTIYKGRMDFSLFTSDDDVTVEDEDTDYTYSRKEADSEETAPWMAPEVFGGRQVWPSGDVYGFGYLVDHVLTDCPQIFLTAPLRQLADACSTWDPEHRPLLSQVAADITTLTQLLTSQQLAQKFIFWGDET